MGPPLTRSWLARPTARSRAVADDAQKRRRSETSSRCQRTSTTARTGRGSRSWLRPRRPTSPSRVDSSKSQTTSKCSLSPSTEGATRRSRMRWSSRPSTRSRQGRVCSPHRAEDDRRAREARRRMSLLLAAVDVACDTLEKSAGDIRALEHFVSEAVSPVFPPTQGECDHLATELAKLRERLETVTRELHAGRRTEAPTRSVERRPCVATRSRRSR